MGTVTFGRAGLAAASGGDGLTLVISDPEDIDWEGNDTLKLQGDFHADTLADAVAMRSQLLGYDSNVDEPVIPFTWSGDTSVNGFYRVQSVTAGTVGQGSYNAYWFEWEAELLAVPGRQAPLFEVACAGAERVDSHAADGLGYVAIPGSAVARDQLSGETSALSILPSGTLVVGMDDSFYDSTVLYSVAPGDAYQGAVTLTQNSRTVTGRQIENDPDGWVLSNGLIKIRPSLTTVNHFVVGVRNSGVTDYDEKAYRIGARSGGSNLEYGWDGTTRYAPTSVTVLRDSPECVAIRVTFKGVTATFAGVLVNNLPYRCAADFTLRRGQIYAECRVSAQGSGGQWGMWRGTTEAGTDITTGVEATSSDASGNKYRIYSPLANTVDTTNGGVYIDSGSTGATFGIGNNRSFLSTGNISNQFFAAQNHRQRIVVQ